MAIKGGKLHRLIILVLLILAETTCAAPSSLPIVDITNPVADSTIKGIVKLDVAVSSTDNDLVSFEMLLDGKQVGVPVPPKMNKTHRFLLDLDTSKLTEGKHTITAKASARGNENNWGSSSITFIVDNQALTATLELLPPNPKQGEVFYLHVISNEDINGLSVDFMEQRPQFYPAETGGYIAALDARPSLNPGEYPIKVTASENSTVSLNAVVTVGDAKFIKEYIDMPATTSSKVLGRTAEQKAQEQQEITDAVTQVDEELYEKGTVIKPIEGKLTSPFYGTRKFSDGNSESHNGVDYYAKEGTPIKADGAGIVRLAKEHIARGKFVCIDHGRGWFTLVYHMSEIDATVG
jgi:murein DD-endopeptidase MepM/ murein hydrolase activator NlpD